MVLESTKLGKCQILLGLKSVRVGKCQKLPIQESVRNSSDLKVSETYSDLKVSEIALIVYSNTF